MATLLSKFRIDYSTITVVPDIQQKPSSETKEFFRDLVQPWMLNESAGETVQNFPAKISAQEMKAQREKSARHMRLRELLLKHSSHAQLIAITLPMPKKGLCSAGLYMAWLETLSRDMPPILLLRGTQESVLTYYS